MAIVFTFRKTAVDTLNAVSAAATGITRTIDAVAGGADMAALYVEHHRRIFAASLDLDADEIYELAEDAAADRIANKQKELHSKFDADSHYKELFLEARATLRQKRLARSGLKIAAE